MAISDALLSAGAGGIMEDKRKTEEESISTVEHNRKLKTQFKRAAIRTSSFTKEEHHFLR